MHSENRICTITRSLRILLSVAILAGPGRDTRCVRGPRGSRLAAGARGQAEAD